MRERIYGLGTATLVMVALAAWHSSAVADIVEDLGGARGGTTASSAMVQPALRSTEKRVLPITVRLAKPAKDTTECVPVVFVPYHQRAAAAAADVIPLKVSLAVAPASTAAAAAPTPSAGTASINDPLSEAMLIVRVEEVEQADLDAFVANLPEAQRAAVKAGVGPAVTTPLELTIRDPQTPNACLTLTLTGRPATAAKA